MRILVIALAVSWSIFAFAEPHSMNGVPGRVVGWGLLGCERWQLSVAVRVAVLDGRIKPENLTFDRRLTLEYEAGEKDYNEALDWVSGYFTAAQRFGNRAPQSSDIATSQIVQRVEQICRVEPSLRLEQAAFRATQEFLK